MATRYIDADKYKADLLVGQEYLDEDTLLTVINLLDCQPTADVVKVVRCKKCKLRETSGCPMYREEYSEWDAEVDLIVTDLTEDEGFCHCGKERE